jgi:DNA-directed RNA polymerase specialized sigma24 family protein
VRAGAARDADDVHHTVLLRLATHLWQVREERAEPIASFAAYVAHAASNGCHEWLRERFPQRTRLQQQIRYVCRHHAALALWMRPSRTWVCGLADWHGQDRVVDRATVAAWRGKLHAPEAGPEASEAGRIVRLVETIVRELGAPVRLDDVVALAADALGIDDRTERVVAAVDSADMAREPVAPVTPIVDSLAQKEFLLRVWEEIRQLPMRQRMALLLNLGGAGQSDMLSLLPATGLVSWGDIAVALDLPPDRLGELQGDLPLDDKTLASLIGATRRQVINLRKCARERLARRLGFARTTGSPR